MMSIRKWNKAPGGGGYRVLVDGKRYFIDLTNDSITIFATDGIRLCDHSENAESAIRGKECTHVIVDDLEAERLRLASFDPKNEARRVFITPVSTKITEAGIELRFSREDAEQIKDAMHRDTLPPVAVDIDAHQRALNTPHFNDLAG